MACHAGYGWQDASFDFKAEENVDCLICHDSTATYRKLPGDAGHPVYERQEFPHGSGRFVEAVDLTKVAQGVAAPSAAIAEPATFTVQAATVPSMGISTAH